MMAAGCHFENLKLPYLSSGSTDRHEIWHGDSCCPSKDDDIYKISIFKKYQTADGSYSKN